MMRSAPILLLFIVVNLVTKSSNAQTIEENKIDEFTKKSTKRTSWDPLSRSNDIWLYSQISKVDTSFYVSLRIIIKGKPFSIKKDDQMLLKLENDSIITLHNPKDEEACRGCGSQNFWTSASKGVEIEYLLSKSAVEYLKEFKVNKIRLYTSRGTVEEDIKGKFADNFFTQVRLIL